jgi:hypothetical protein
MENAKKAGNTAAYNAAATARFYKIMGDYGAYGQYDDGNYVIPGQQRTEAGNQFDQTMKYNYDLLEAEKAEKNGISSGTASGRVISSGSGSKSTTKPTLTAAQAKDALKSGVTTQEVLDAYNYYYGDGAYDLFVAGGPSQTPPMTDKEVKNWVDELNLLVDNKYPGKTALNQVGIGNYKRGDIDADWIIRQVYNSDSLTQEQMDYLLYDKFGITEAQVNTASKDPHYK